MIELFDVLAQVASVAPSPSEAPAPGGGGSPLSTSPSDFTSVVIRTLISAGPVGLVLIAILFKKGIMTTSEHDTFVAAAQARETVMQGDIDELKAALRDANGVYTGQVIPTLTRVLDAERELVDLRRAEATRAQVAWQRPPLGGPGSGI